MSRHATKTDKRYFVNEGTRYIDFMADVRRVFGVETYFEIGSDTGLSLEPVECAAIAVDPSFKLATPVIGKKPLLMLFQMTSDTFFEKYDLTGLFGGPVQMAFLDGLHYYEYLLRDFMNVEKHMRRNSVVFLHDCMPPTYEVAQRQHPGVGKGWAGDVWKAVAILQKYRPDLRITPVNCPPTGLMMITNLDPTSTVLEESYFEAVHSMTAGPDDEAALAAYQKRLGPVVQSAELKTLAALSSHIWL